MYISQLVCIERERAIGTYEREKDRGRARERDQVEDKKGIDIHSYEREVGREIERGRTKSLDFDAHLQVQ